LQQARLPIDTKLKLDASLTGKTKPGTLHEAGFERYKSASLLAVHDRSNGRCPVAGQLLVLKKCKFHPTPAEQMSGFECMRKTKATP
jgi:hypothetical protein